MRISLLQHLQVLEELAASLKSEYRDSHLVVVAMEILLNVSGRLGIGGEMIGETHQ